MIYIGLIEKHLSRVWEAYLEQVEHCMRDGALPTKMKELIAPALSIAVHCEPCVKIHLRKALKAGATEEEIAETLGVTLLLCGGSSEVWPRKTIAEELGK